MAFAYGSATSKDLHSAFVEARTDLMNGPTKCGWDKE